MFRIVLGIVFSIFVISKEAEYKDYKIGVITSLTGVAADYGVAIKNGIELALQDKYLVEVKKVNLVIT